MDRVRKFFNKFKATRLLDSLILLQFISIVNGFLPYYLDKDGKTIKLRKLSVIMGVSNYVFITACLVLTIPEINELQNTYFKTDVLSSLPLLNQVSVFCSLNFMFIVSILRRRHLRKTMQLLTEVDSKFPEFKLEYQRVTNLTIFMISMILLFLLSMRLAAHFVFGETNETYNPTFPLRVILLGPTLSMWFYVSVFITFIFMVKLCLDGINQVSSL